MRLAIISDIHGNSFALEAVLEDIAGNRVDAVLNLGDNLASPIAPRETADMLMSLNWPSIRGNHDRWMVEQPLESQGRIDRFATAAIADRHREWLAILPPTLEYEGVLLCHGTPTNDEQFWLEGYFKARQATLPSEADVTKRANGYDHKLILCGHTHTARAVRLRDGRQIVNPGSVGLQIVHGSPDARYAIVERRDGKWSVSFRVVAYDHEAAARAADANGFPQWREALTSGWADPDGLF
jgi:putative phosphoesterase